MVASEISILFDDIKNGEALLFSNPITIISAYNYDQIHPSLVRMQKMHNDGYYLSGFFAYEFGYYYESKLRKLASKIDGNVKPLLWFGVFDRAEVISSKEIELWLGMAEFNINNIKPDCDFTEYNSKFNKVKQYISDGDIYQANLTFKAFFDFSGCSASLYRDLRTKQQCSYAAYLRTGNFDILSLSPELFLRKEGLGLTAKPMKGTIRRGVSIADDKKLQEILKNDPKSRAENLMIVDLLRNDLSIVSANGSVITPELFTIETYNTIQQMTSTVKAEADYNLSALEIVTKIFPCGSITGAPKIRAMEVINELEVEDRGVYCGSIGMIEPNGDFCFNVAIRTLEISNNIGQIGIGSGIVYDSDVKQEYQECLLKMNFLNKDHNNFEIIETLGWHRNEGFRRVNRHLFRLEQSAKYFEFIYDIDKLTELLENIGKEFANSIANSYRVRITLNGNGKFDITYIIIDSIFKRHIKVALSSVVIDQNNCFTYHKTTRREHLDVERERIKSFSDCDEVLFCNDKGELTEGSYTNLFIQIAGELYTPPLDSGLLPGVLRQELLDNNKVKERYLTVKNLFSAEKVYMGNSLRGLLEAEIDFNVSS